jgi:polysaccharide deacetylase family protein (PEP-CTERM system associated)
MTHHILITVDVEDWFQVENFKQCIPFSSWPNCELRVEANTLRLLDLLDSKQLVVGTQHPTPTDKTNPTNETNATNEPTCSMHNRATSNNQEPGTSIQHPVSSIQVKATFFILGWLAERLPHLVREIHSRGHEVGSHGYYHELCTKESDGDLKRDLVDSKTLLEDIIGAPIFGYRAPSFCINHNILKIIKDSGYLYDSSFNSFGMHGRYGRLALSQNGKSGVALRYQWSTVNHQSSILYELPISNLTLGKHVFPWGGGGYFRLIPFPLFKYGVRSLLQEHGAYLFYMHPWEIDSGQPKVNHASSFFKFRHYVNLHKTACRLSSFIESFSHCTFSTCSQYLADRGLRDEQ